MTGLAEKIQLSELSLSFILPEIILAIGIVLLVFTILFKPSTKKTVAWTISFLAILFSIFLILSKLSSYSNPIYLFHGQLVQHAPALLFILVCDVAMLIGLFMSLPYIQKDENVFLILLLSILLGCHLLCLSANWLIFFISLELIAIPGYLLAAFQKEKKNFEASIKYFVFGSFISALMLYGISWLYGITGTFNFYDAAFNEQIQLNQHAMLFIAVCLLLGGLLFKINVAPAHAWSPDVYEGAPAPVVAILSVVPKIAATGALLFVCYHIQTRYGVRWSVLIAYLSLFTLLVGNLSALRQKNARRMMAYSSIAQSGFLLMAILNFDLQNLPVVLFYAIVFVLGNYCVFLLILHAEKNGIDKIEDYAGKGKKYFWWIFSASVGLIALAGLPPTAGFTGKFLIFTQLWEQYQVRPSALWLNLLIVGIINTALALFYYIKIPYFAFLKEENTALQTETTSKKLRNFPVLALVLALLLISLFLFPSMLMGWLNSFNFAIR